MVYHRRNPFCVEQSFYSVLVYLTWWVGVQANQQYCGKKLHISKFCDILLYRTLSFYAVFLLYLHTTSILMESRTICAGCLQHGDRKMILSIEARGHR